VMRTVAPRRFLGWHDHHLAHRISGYFTAGRISNEATEVVNLLIKKNPRRPGVQEAPQ
jgi:hypothetical protein